MKTKASSGNPRKKWNYKMLVAEDWKPKQIGEYHEEGIPVPIRVYEAGYAIGAIQALKRLR